MKRYILYILFFVCQCCDTPGNAQKIVDEIDQEISSYQLLKYPDADLYKDTPSGDYSLEGVEIHNLATIKLEKYYAKSQLKKITLYFNGENSELKSDYYCKGEQLLFARRVLSTYDLPKWHDDFDSSKVKVDEYSFQFEDNSLVEHFLNGKVVNNTANIGQDVLLDFKVYKEYTE